MLSYNIKISGERWEEDYQQFLNRNLDCLRRVQEGQAKYADSQDWLDTRICAGKDVLNRILDKAGEIRENADTFVLIGVGGSNNAARSVVEAIAPRREGVDPEIIYAGNTLNPTQLKKMLSKLENRSCYIECIAKNFETLEPGSSFRILRELMDRKYGKKAHERIITCGTVGSSLDRLSREQGYDFFDFPSKVGGRFTAMTNVGFLPVAVAGIDIQSLVAGAHMMQMLLHAKRGKDNMAYQYACLRNFCYQKNHQVEMLSSFEPRFRFFYKWWIQLFAESEGKDNRGILPVTGEFSEELHSIGQFIQEGTPMLFETFLDVKEADDNLMIHADGLSDAFDYLDEKDFADINRAAFDATVQAHAERLPVSILQLDRLDAYGFGQLFYFFQFACYISCEMMGANPFNQPGVEAYKKRMFRILEEK